MAEPMPAEPPAGAPASKGGARATWWDRAGESVFRGRFLQQFAALFYKNGAWGHIGAGGRPWGGGGGQRRGGAARRGAVRGPRGARRRAAPCRARPRPRGAARRMRTRRHAPAARTRNAARRGVARPRRGAPPAGAAPRFEWPLPGPARRAPTRRPRRARAANPVLVAWRSRRATAIRLLAPFVFLLLALIINLALEANNAAQERIKESVQPPPVAIGPIPSCNQDLFIGKGRDCVDFIFTPDRDAEVAVRGCWEAGGRGWGQHGGGRGGRRRGAAEPGNLGWSGAPQPQAGAGAAAMCGLRRRGAAAPAAGDARARAPKTLNPRNPRPPRAPPCPAGAHRARAGKQRPPHPLVPCQGLPQPQRLRHLDVRARGLDPRRGALQPRRRGQPAVRAAGAATALAAEGWPGGRDAPGIEMRRPV
jgi:hypothetical protein